MLRPNACKKSVFNKWICDALSELSMENIKNPCANVVQKQIYKNQPGILFSKNWFKVQYKKFVSSLRVSG
jgi:hypothetical protein